MSLLLHAVRTRRRGGGDQGGYLLMIAIVAVAFLGILTIALLGMMFADASSRSVYARQERDRRAAEGALQTAINTMKTTPAAVVPDGACGDVDNSSLTLEQRTVTVRCTPQSVTGTPVAAPGDSGDSAALTLLGNYNGALDDAANNNLGGWLSSAVGALANALNGYLSQGPGLVHYGPEPLRLVGNVDVRQSALARKDPAPSPAVAVTGNYRQGDVGLLGNQNITIFGIPILITPSCGLLDPNVGADATDIGMQVRATGTVSCGVGRNTIATPTATAPATFTAAQRRAGTTLPTCVSGTVVQFTPGAYNRVQTAVMNTWFAQSNPVCNNVTFYFPPGDYFFDAGGWFGGDRNSLVFADPTSHWVFGTPRGWSPPSSAAAAFPQACDRNAAGVTITLSSRTALKHKGGRVSVCGPAISTGRPAIYQESGGTTLSWAGAPTAAVTTGNAQLANFTNMGAATASLAPKPASYPDYGSDWAGTEATRQTASITCPSGCVAGIRFTGFVDPGEPAPSGQLTKAVVKIRGAAENVPALGVPAQGSPQTRVIVYYGDGSTSYNTCQVDVPDVPRNYDENFLTINLLTACNNGTYQLIDASQLENAVVEVHVSYPIGYCFLCTPPAAVGRIDHAWIETTTTPAPASPFSTIVDPTNQRSMTVSGLTYLPQSNVEVGWWGEANSVPIFVGRVVARGLGSLNLNSSVHTGVFAARKLAEPRRRVTLRAVIDGRVRASAEVEITDADPTGVSLDPGRLLEVVDWQLCNLPSSAASC